jgi:hypothetical protein
VRHAKAKEGQREKHAERRRGDIEEEKRYKLRRKRNRVREDAKR